ncbi:MAG: radical SAM protein [Elusimicrobia bacterium]|nr:radical SAM protein [Elusimicrobiota bacterium]
MRPSESNEELNRREISERRTVLESRPVALIVHLTERCNINCPMCIVKKRRWEISDKTLGEIKDLLPYLRHACWTGGETFLYPRFRELLEAAHRQEGLSQSIYTNGLLLDRDWMELLIRGDMTLIFSVDGTEPGVYEAIRRGARFEDLCRSLDLARRYQGRTAFRLDLKLSVAVMRTNHRRLGGFVEFARSRGIGELEFGPYIGDDREENIFKFRDEAAVSAVVESLRALAAEAAACGIKLFNRLPYNYSVCDKDKTLNSGPDLFCTFPWTWLHILPGGKVIPHGHCKQVVGDVSRGSILEIWNGPGMQSYRRKLADGSFDDWCRSDRHWMDLVMET